MAGNGPASYVVKGDVSDAVWYASSESSADNKPQLIVTTGSGGPGNNPPSATVSLSDTTPETNDVLTATATKSDPDAGDTVLLTYVWKVNGVDGEDDRWELVVDGHARSVGCGEW